MANLLFAVTYQVHKPDPNASDQIADLYRLAPVEAHVVAAAQDQATLSAVITNNITLQPGEVFDIPPGRTRTTRQQTAVSVI